MNTSNEPNASPAGDAPKADIHQRDSKPEVAHSQPAIAGGEPVVAYSQPAIAGGEPVQWWLRAMDLNAMARERAASGHAALYWEHSILDLLKLAGQDHRPEARVWMARVPGWPDPQPSNHSVVSAEMNAWLCKRLKEELVKNGSTMPKTGD